MVKRQRGGQQCCLNWRTASQVLFCGVILGFICGMSLDVLQVGAASSKKSNQAVNGVAAALASIGPEDSVDSNVATVQPEVETVTTGFAHSAIGSVSTPSSESSNAIAEDNVDSSVPSSTTIEDDVESSVSSSSTIDDGTIVSNTTVFERGAIGEVVAEAAKASNSEAAHGADIGAVVSPSEASETQITSEEKASGGRQRSTDRRRHAAAKKSAAPSQHQQHGLASPATKKICKCILYPVVLRPPVTRLWQERNLTVDFAIPDYLQTMKTFHLDPPVIKATIETLLHHVKTSTDMFEYPVTVDYPVSKAAMGQNGYRVESLVAQLVPHWLPKTTKPSSQSLLYLPTLSAGTGKSSMFKYTYEVWKKAHEGYSFLKKHGAKQHFWTSTHDLGKESGKLLPPSFLNGSSALVNTADAFDGYMLEAWINEGHSGKPPFLFDPRKDVSLPCNANVELAAASRSVSVHQKRKYSIFFAGKGYRDRKWHVRNLMLESLHGFPDTMISASIPSQYYKDRISQSNFCLCPRGSRVWSPRLMEAVWFGCIPVIVADHYWLPQGCFWDWSKMSLIIPEADARDVASHITKAIANDAWVAEARRRLIDVREYFIWNLPRARAADAFEMTMLEVWLRQRGCSSLLR